MDSLLDTNVISQRTKATPNVGVVRWLSQTPIAEEAGRLTSIGKKVGSRPDFADALIAATARVYGLRLVTLNWVHFKDLGVELVKF